MEVNIDSFDSELKAKEFINTSQRLIVRKFGRCYEDNSLAKTILPNLNYNHFLDFEKESTILKDEASISLAEILDVFVNPTFFACKGRNKFCYSRWGNCILRTWQKSPQKKLGLSCIGNKT